jgi:hypothetical protein
VRIFSSNSSFVETNWRTKILCRKEPKLSTNPNTDQTAAAIHSIKSSCIPQNSIEFTKGRNLVWDQVVGDSNSNPPDRHLGSLLGREARYTSGYTTTWPKAHLWCFECRPCSSKSLKVLVACELSRQRSGRVVAASYVSEFGDATLSLNRNWKK